MFQTEPFKDVVFRITFLRGSVIGLLRRYTSAEVCPFCDLTSRLLRLSSEPPSGKGGRHSLGIANDESKINVPRAECFTSFNDI